MSAASNDWFYVDDDGNEQGPYSFDNVCAWFKDAYFDESTMLRHKSASDTTKLGDLPEFDHLLESKTDHNADDEGAGGDDGDDLDAPTTAHEPLKLGGVVIPPPPGWNGEPIVSNAAAVLQATQEIADTLAAIEQQQQQQATSAKWTDAEFEHWSLMAQRMIATPQLLPAAIWQRLEVERRERQRIAAMAAKFMKDHQIKGLKRKKYSWSAGFKGFGD